MPEKSLPGEWQVNGDIPRHPPAPLISLRIMRLRKVKKNEFEEQNANPREPLSRSSPTSGGSNSIPCAKGEKMSLVTSAATRRARLRNVREPNS